MRRPMLCFVSVAALAVLSGCGSDGVVTPHSNPQGEYALEMVNGIALPFLKAESGSDRVEVVSGSLTLRANGTYRGEIVEQLTSGSNSELLSVTRSGTFSVSGSQLAFTEYGSTVMHHGTISGNRITATMNDVTFGFVLK